MVKEFEQEYSPNKALWWYSRESFLYKMLNKALRIQNIDLLFLLRFVISDAIYRQMKQHQCQTPTINSLFWTFIDADPQMVTSKPFADISSCTDFINEAEVSFMVECVFRLIDICQDGEIWMIRMQLCENDDHDLKDLFQHMKKEYGGSDNKVDLGSLGHVLLEMGKYDLAEKIYHRLLVELPCNDPSLSSLYYSLDMVPNEKRNYDSSLKWYNESLEIKLQTNPSDYIDIGSIHSCIDVVHWRTGNEHKAIELCQQRRADDNPNMAYSYNNIALIYNDQKKYSEALNYYEKSLVIKEKHFPTGHSSLTNYYNNIGIFHQHLHHHDLAIEHYH